VHVKALIETNGSSTALEIIVQDENTKTPPTTTATGTNPGPDVSLSVFWP
jgi:hypothetical protein